MIEYAMLVFFFSQCFIGIHGIPSISNDTNPIENLNLNLYQGDIFLRNKALAKFKGRSAIAHEWAKWPDGTVYYELDGSFSDEDVGLIKSAMEEFHQQTCVRWKERKNNEENYVEIENTMGCWAEAGMQGGPQALALESPRCMKKGVVLHELMHALGFLHEVSRHDRDDYVVVHFDNVIAGMEENFVKLNRLQLDTLGLEYDYKSVMHYKAWSFAKDRSHPTITPTDDAVGLSELGHGQEIGEFTETDVQKVKKFYGCSE